MISKTMKLRITAFENAVEQSSLKGSQNPETHTAITHQYERCKQRLIEQIEEETSLGRNGSQLSVGNRKTFQQEPVDPKDHS